MCVPIGANDHVGAGCIHHIARWSLDFCQHVCAGSQIRDFDFTAAVRPENPVLRRAAGANHAVQSHLAACGGGYSELRTRQGLVGLAVALLDNDRPLGLVFEGKRNRASLLDLNGLRLRINHESSGGLRFRYNHALAGLQAVNTDFAVFVSTVNSVAVPNQRSIRVHDFKLCVCQCDAGVYRANLPDQETAIRRVGKPDCDNALLTAVRDEHGFGRIDDAVAVGRVHFFNHISSRFESGPDTRAVFAGDFLADDCAAGAGGARQIAELEGTSRQGLVGHTVIFLHDDAI